MIAATMTAMALTPKRRERASMVLVVTGTF
jgi:hypothetical protein